MIVVPGAAGVDEAGRGCLAGPVFAAAVILPPDFDVGRLDDSKRVRRDVRETLRTRIEACATWAVCSIDAAEIDRINILRASLRAMSDALARLTATPTDVYVDGDRLPPGVEAHAIVKGDTTYAAIAAASILAKTHRDEWMRAAASEYPEYSFDQNFGYGTPEHLDALERFGPCPLHRRSFAPVADVSESLFREMEYT